MDDLTGRVEGFHNEFAKQPPLFTMIVAETRPVDDEQLATVIEADGNALIARGIAPLLGRYHPFVYDHEPNEKSRTQAVMAHTMGLVEFKEYSVGKAEKEALEELYRWDRSDLARFARMAAEGKATREVTHQEADEPIHFTGIIHGPGGTKKSLASLRAADVARVRIRLSMLVVLIVGVLLGLAAAYLSQEKTNEAKKIVTNFNDSGFMHRAAFDDEWSGRPWRDNPWEQRVEYEYRSHKKLFDCDHTLDDFKKLFPDDSASDGDDDLGSMRRLPSVQEGNLQPVRVSKP